MFDLPLPRHISTLPDSAVTTGLPARSLLGDELRTTYLDYANWHKTAKVTVYFWGWQGVSRLQGQPFAPTAPSRRSSRRQDIGAALRPDRRAHGRRDLAGGAL
jgi:hypothetical protein